MPSSSQEILSTPQKFIIVGGGPAGLYTVIKLVRKGINPSQIILCDPRIGRYTRPGHLAKHAFDVASKGIAFDFDIDFKKGKTTTYAHIKDIERALHEIVMGLGITIMPERFSKLTPVDDGVNVIFENEKSDSILLTGNDYLFDCTGSRRIIVNSVNTLFPQSPPFKLENITNEIYKHHFLAYVQMSEDEITRLTERHQEIEGLGMRWIKNFKDKILALRQLGWQENALPRLYWVPFGKDKLCFYLHAPESLAQENYDNWFQAALNLYAENIKYEHLPPSKKYGEKPRFVHFQTSANSLLLPYFKQAGFPQVLALGDAMIDPDYYLAHGISNAFSIIDILMENNMVVDPEQGLIFYDLGFMFAINEKINPHKEAIIREGKVANFNRQYFFKVANEIASEDLQPNSDSIAPGT